MARWTQAAPLRAWTILCIALFAIQWTRDGSTQAVELKATHCPGEGNQCSQHGVCAINRQGEHVCNCQWGYNSPDCSRKMCPYGTNPTSSQQEEKKIRLRIATSGGISITGGALAVTFHAHTVEFEMPLEQVTSEACTTIFRRFQNLGDLACERVAFDRPSTATFEVTLRSFPTFPIMNNLYYHDGNPPASEVWCDTAGAQLSSPSGSVQCVFEEVSDANVKSYEECSGHGDCNSATGICACNEGFYGDHCGNNRDDEDILNAPARGPFFKGNVLHLSATRELSSDFQLVRADVGGQALFTMNGRGDTTWHHGSLKLRDGGLYMSGGSALQLQKYSTFEMKDGRARLQDSPLHLQLQTATEPSTNGAALLNIERLTAASTAELSMLPDFFRITQPKGPILRVSGAGQTVIHSGGLEILKGGLRLERGGIQVLSDGVKVMSGGLEVQNGNLAVRSGTLSLKNGQTTLAGPAGPVLLLQRDNIDGASPSSPLIQAKGSKSSDSTVFEVLDSGSTVVHGGGVHVLAGGVTIESGGQTIISGGLRVESGGVHVESGSLTTRDGFAIEDGGLIVQTDQVNGRALRVASTNANFAGTLLNFDISGQHRDTPPFRILEALKSSPGIDATQPEDVFSVDSLGNLETRGDITTTHGGRIIASGALVSQGQAVFSNVQLRASDNLVIPSTNSYVQVTSDGVAAPNQARIDLEHAHAGQLLIIQNDDEQPLGGELNVAAGAAAIFVFDGGVWRPLTAAAFDTSSLTGVKAFEAANDLNLGEVTLTVQSVQVAGQRSGFVAVYGKGGVLEQHESLRFEAASGTFSADKIEANRMRGSIDMSESELRSVDIVGGHISNVNMTAIEMVEVQGELFVEDEAFFGASVTVDGQVMGSGAYVDASDERFKVDVRQISNASEVVAQLRGVEYAYNLAMFPDKFPHAGRRELGFIAQEVERVAPQVVSTDGDGFKYVAYARLIPVVVEALKREQKRADDSEERLQQLEADVRDLKRALQTQYETLQRILGQVENEPSVTNDKPQAQEMQ